MEIVGRSAATLDVVYRHTLAHGEDPYRAARQRGHRLQRALRAHREGADVVLEVLVCALDDADGDPHAARHRAPASGSGLPREVPVVRQRVAAYSIIVSDRGVLATQFSDKTGAAGLWGLPGGGVEPGEEPADTVVREAYEETSQHLLDPMILDVQSDHWVGRAPTGVLEDFHAVRLVFTGRVLDPTPAVVLDVDGTTADSRWVPLAQWRSLAWTGGARSLLEKHLECCVAGFALPLSR